MQSNDSPCVSGATSDCNVSIGLNSNTFGNNFITVSVLGFDTDTSPIFIQSDEQPSKSSGTLKLSEGTPALN